MSALLLLSISLASFPIPGARVAAPSVAAPGIGFGSAPYSSWIRLAPEPSPPADTPDAVASSPDEGPPPDITEPEIAEPEPPVVEEPPAVEEPEELGIDDIFGTSEDHTDVTVISEKGEEPDTQAASTSNSSVATARTPRANKLYTRTRIVSSVYYDTARVEQRGFGRNENRLEFYFAYTPNEHLQIVGDIEPVFFGISQAQELDDLASRQLLTPFHVESDAAYVALNDVLPNLDIKIGRQILVWGSADRFNPTSNINADDLEDRPLFTEPIANQMVVVDFAPLADKLWFQGVYVPIFYPALLPPSAAIALKDPQAPVPFTEQEDLDQIGALQNLLGINEMLVPEVTTTVKVPRPRFTNGQSAIKMGTTLSGVDLTFSYFNGRHDIPTPILAEAGTKDPGEGDGLGCCYTSRVTLIYPRMQVIGADFSTQVPILRDMGLWGEGAMFLPQAQEFLIEFPIAVDVTPGGQPNDDGITNPVRSMIGPTILDRPFIKATAGLDYTFGEHVYVQGQYLRGFIDEFGVGHIGNYVVGGTDLIFFGRHLIFRMFGVVDIPTERGDSGSYVLYPELILVPPWGSVTLEIGSFFLLGESDTKFGQPGAGSSIAFVKVAGQF